MPMESLSLRIGTTAGDFVSGTTRRGADNPGLRPGGFRRVRDLTGCRVGKGPAHFLLLIEKGLFTGIVTFPSGDQIQVDLEPVRQTHFEFEQVPDC